MSSSKNIRMNLNKEGKYDLELFDDHSENNEEKAVWNLEKMCKTWSEKVNHGTE